MDSVAKTDQRVVMICRRFAERGVGVRSAVPAFTGLYPFFNGYGNWEIFATDPCLLASGDDATIQVWSTLAFNRSVPRQLVLTTGADKVSIYDSPARYTAVYVEDSKLWVHRRYVSYVKNFTTPS